ncbi:MAG TPA: hypothetical protein VM261_18120 [Kofleriaceae bacterium]|nr:hypothetical protein [Kofleriaceae bacterium]
MDATLEMLPIGRRMVILRMGNGSLAVHSAVCCNPETLASIEALGPVRWIIVPSGHHRMDAPAWKARFPDARVVAMPDSQKRVGQVVAVDGDYGALPVGGVTWQALDGVPSEGVFLHRAPDGAVTAIFNDAFMNLPASLPGFKGWVVKMMGSTGGPKVTRTAKYFIVKNRPAYAAHLRRLADTPGLARVIPGHGDVVASDAAAALHRAADGLHKPS